MNKENLPKYTELPNQIFEAQQESNGSSQATLEVQAQQQSQQEEINTLHDQDLERSSCPQCEELKLKLKEKNNEIAKIIFVFLLISLIFFAFIVSGPRHRGPPH
ncbi:unnamed protein product [Candida verbasci]|uniref:Uncharacterized protein n=1 Tax=Candida verbasci TaxID=1227364 RepID=A0A9W4TQ28_9ASCO|nr:unnamed protein product [Candida verbasci]